MVVVESASWLYAFQLDNQGRTYRGCSRCGRTWARGSWGPVDIAKNTDVHPYSAKITLISVIGGICAPGEGRAGIG